MNYLVTAAGAAAVAVALPSSSDAGDQAPLMPPGRPADHEAEVDSSAPTRLQDFRMQRDYDYSDYPEIFGKVPDGFVLERQAIEMLCFWHRKVGSLIDQLPDGPDYQAIDEKLDEYSGLKNRIYGTILSAPVASVGEVAAKFGAVIYEVDSLETSSIEEVLDVEDIVKLSTELATAVRSPITPKKHVGALHRGRKLTRAGLLSRYQSFLVGELETVSWNLYGERDFAKHVVFYDYAVKARCDSPTGPFFDEAKLATRAHSVLSSLGIDTENVAA